MDPRETLPDELRRDFSALGRRTADATPPLQIPNRTQAQPRHLRRTLLAAALVLLTLGSFLPVDRTEIAGERISISVTGPGAAVALSNVRHELTDILGEEGTLYESNGTHLYSGLSSSADDGTLQRIQRVVTTLVSQGLSVQMANASEVVRTEGSWIHPASTRSLRIELLEDGAESWIVELRRRLDELQRNDVTIHELETSPGSVGIEIRYATDEELPLALLLEGLGKAPGDLLQERPLIVESLQLRTEYSSGSTLVVFEDGQQVRRLELLGDFRGRESELQQIVQQEFDELGLEFEVDWVEGEWILNHR